MIYLRFTAAAGESDEGKDHRAVIIIAAMLAVTVILTLVKATYDPVTQAELKSLKISAFDVILFLTAVIGYFVMKKRKVQFFLWVYSKAILLLVPLLITSLYRYKLNIHQIFDY